GVTELLPDDRRVRQPLVVEQAAAGSAQDRNRTIGTRQSIAVCYGSMAWHMRSPRAANRRRRNSFVVTTSFAEDTRASDCSRFLGASCGPQHTNFSRGQESASECFASISNAVEEMSRLAWPDSLVLQAESWA